MITKSAIENIIDSVRDEYRNIDILLERFLKSLYTESDYERVAIFIKRRKGTTFYLRKMIYQGHILEGEEIIGLKSHKPLASLFAMKSNYILTSEPIFGIYIPIISDKNIIGLLRLEDSREGKISENQLAQLEKIARALGNEIKKHFMYRNAQDQQKMLEAYYSLSEILVSSLEAKEIIISIIQEIQKNFLFDNLKIYLLDKDRKYINGFAQGDFNGNISKLDETYKLDGVPNRIVDIVKNPEDTIYIWEDLMVDIVLRAREDTIGVLSAHNLISQQDISKRVMSFLKSISNHIGISIKNAIRFEEVTHLSKTDSLTGLYRSGYFRNKIQEELQRANRYNQQFGLVVIDVDDFKNINDKYGHQIGDDILIELARMLNSTIRKIDYAGRVGGDEFVVYLSNTNREHIKVIVSRLFEKLNTIDKLNVSIGVSVFPYDGSTYKALFKKADESMYSAKKKGKNRCVFTFDR